MFVDPCILVQFLQKNPTRCNNVSKFYYSIFVWSSTCFGRHIAHHQKPKTALAASGFSHVEGCWTCRWWTLSGTLCLTKYVFCACAITFQTQKDEIWFLRVCHHISNAVRRNLVSARVPSHFKSSLQDEFQSGANPEILTGGVKGGLIMTLNVIWPILKTMS